MMAKHEKKRGLQQFMRHRCSEGMYRGIVRSPRNAKTRQSHLTPREK
jgi:hypothetical protein